jgi:hypothetical protein
VNIGKLIAGPTAKKFPRERERSWSCVACLPADPNKRAQAYRRRLRDLFRVGRTSLLIGLAALASAIALGDFLAGLMRSSCLGEIVRESFTIGGWVSMWRPLEIFLYDWWPIRDEARLYDPLAAMPVPIRYLNAKEPDAWKGDWPVVTARGERTTGEADPRTLNQAR